MLKLIKPNEKYYKQYKEMLFRMEEVEKGENLGEYATSTTYWLYDETNKLMEATNLRHYLTE